MDNIYCTTGKITRITYNKNSNGKISQHLQLQLANGSNKTLTWDIFHSEDFFILNDTLDILMEDGFIRTMRRK